MNPSDASLYRATAKEIDAAFALVSEYYAEVGVVAREDRETFEQQYFAEGSGFWFALVDGAPAGCVALRKLDLPAKCGEIKRMYVRSPLRGRRIAAALLRELERYAATHGYIWLYLDTTDRMAAAARFYERHGYQRCGRYNDNPQATVFMRKRITGT